MQLDNNVFDSTRKLFMNGIVAIMKDNVEIEYGGVISI